MNRVKLVRKCKKEEYPIFINVIYKLYILTEVSYPITHNSLYSKEERIFLNNLRVARIATVNPDYNFPHLVPICYVFDQDLFFTSLRKNSRRLTNLNKRREVSILFDEYQEENGIWVILRGLLIKSDVKILNFNEHSDNFMKG
ncbi:MAG: pyridoxamine 5'-phosphate oxidase family protein [Candidatus Hodarchaeota archaeon]